MANRSARKLTVSLNPDVSDMVYFIADYEEKSCADIVYEALTNRVLQFRKEFGAEPELREADSLCGCKRRVVD